MENCYTAGLPLQNSLTKLGLGYSSAQTQVKVEPVHCTMLSGTPEDPCAARVTAAPDVHPQAKLPGHICLVQLGTDSQMNSLV